MKLTNQVSYLIVLGLLFSFVSVNSVSFTPAMPLMGRYFNISSNTTGNIVTFFIIGCTFSQLIYGPLTNYLGIKNAAKLGALLSIVGACGCILSYYLSSFYLLLFSRFIAAIGAGSGVNLTYTISSQIFNSKDNARAMSLVSISLALLPNIAIFFGGVTVSFFNWTGPFYIIAAYSVAIFLLIKIIPDEFVSKNKNALKFKNILNGYITQFKSLKIILGSLMVGVASAVLFVFTALGPFIGMNLLGLTPIMYGKYCLILSIGKLLGALSSGYCSKIISSFTAIWCGFIICFSSISIMCLLFIYKLPVILFISMALLYYGLGFVFPNILALTMNNTNDRSNTSAMLSFISTLFSFMIVQALVFIKFSIIYKLVFTYLVLLLFGIVCYILFLRYNRVQHI